MIIVLTNLGLSVGSYCASATVGSRGAVAHWLPHLLCRQWDVQRSEPESLIFSLAVGVEISEQSFFNHPTVFIGGRN